MDILDVKSEQVRVVMSHEELLIFNAALNEICNGIEIFEFETRIGSNRERVVALLNDVRRVIDKIGI